MITTTFYLPPTLEQAIAVLNLSRDWNLSVTTNGRTSEFFDGDQHLLTADDERAAQSFIAGCFLSTYHGMTLEMILDDVAQHHDRYRITEQWPALRAYSPVTLGRRLREIGLANCQPTCAVWYTGDMTQQALTYEPADLAQRVVDELSDKQVEDIALIDVSKVSGFTDFFVIGTANNERQMKAVLDALDRDLGNGAQVRAREGAADSGWVLIDFGDVIVHLFSADARAFYRLDELWSRNAPIVRFT